MKWYERDARAAASTNDRRMIDRPFLWGFAAALGILVAAAFGLALYTLSGLVFTIFIAAFITVGLDPLVRTLQRRGMSRPVAILTVILILILVMVGILLIVLPAVVQQVAQISASLPAQIERLKAEGWFDGTNEASNGVIGAALTWIATTVQSPAFWATVGGGVTKIGVSIASAIGGGFFTLILTIFFIGTYDATKNAAYKLVARSHRASFISYSEQILANVGSYLAGMVTLAFMNAVFSTILLLLVGIPGAILIGIVAFFITIIPLIGTVLTTIAMSVIAFIYSPTAGLIVLIAMLIYMQIEAYVLTPRVMSKAVSVPGSVVLISAIAGGTLFGLPGTLVAIPISAGILLIIQGVVMPRKELA